MEKCGSTSSSSKNMDQLADNITSLSLDNTTFGVQQNATHGCQHFLMRQYVADTWENDRKACSPLEEKNYEEASRRLTAKLSTLQLCPSIKDIACEKESAQEGVTIRPRTKFCRVHPNGRVNVNQRKTRFAGQELVRPEETENAKRPSPFSQDTEVISRKRLKVTGEPSFPCQDKQKGMFRISGTGPNPLLRHYYEKLEAKYKTEPFTPRLKTEENSVERRRDTN